MEVYQPLRVILFMYEMARLVFVAAAARGFMAAEGSGTEFFSPYVVFMAPNALFPLMSLFLWLHLERYRPYLSLYMAGKIVSVVSAAAWIVSSFRKIPESLYAGGAQALVLLGMAFVFVFTDLLSVGGLWFLRNRLRGKKAPAAVYGGTECV
ncbi:MAG: hypothetical protein LBT95_03445 [Treponema sp.]|jgi:TM2 domain-containing membrane protein YozV|nr:hypothetical protein [Treponema sp.]